MYKLPDRKPHERRGMMYDDVMVTVFNYYIAHERRRETINHNLAHSCIPLKEGTLLFPLETASLITIYYTPNANHTALRYQVVDKEHYKSAPICFVGYSKITDELKVKSFCEKIFPKSKYDSDTGYKYYLRYKEIPISDMYSLVPVKLHIDPEHFIVSYIKIDPSFFYNNGVLNSRKTLKNINLERYYADPKKYQPGVIYEF